MGDAIMDSCRDFVYLGVIIGRGNGGNDGL